MVLSSFVWMINSRSIIIDGLIDVAGWFFFIILPIKAYFIFLCHPCIRGLVCFVYSLLP